MDDLSEEITPADFDVAVIGAGPAGCEAALAAAAAGANVLCLTINLDTVGYPPATPVLAENSGDRRHALLAESRALGGRLPVLLGDPGVANRGDTSGSLLVDRRLLGLAWKEAIEHADGLSLRQTLVTHIEPCDSGWQINTGLAERFTAASVVIATGTFLNGRVIDAGRSVPGGRWAEIPSNSLAACLRDLGIGFTEVWARTSPRLSSRGAPEAADSEARLYPDGVQLDELFAYEMETEGDRISQLRAMRDNEGFDRAWITRPSYTVFHDVLEAQQVGRTMESARFPGLFFTGRTAGSCSYAEASVLGLVAGQAAAQNARTVRGSTDSKGSTGAKGSKDANASVRTNESTGANEPMCSDKSPAGFEENTEAHVGETGLLDLLIDRIVSRKNRPVTIRIDAENGC